jgi:hypothetical protein
VQTINYIILIFLPEITSDIVCRWRAYFGYMSISAVTYSYFVQAISRLLFSGFSTKYPWVTTFKTHYVLILTHWILVIIIPSPSVITKDITFRPGLLCWVPIQFIIHVGYTVFAYYVIPALTIVIIYIWIYKQLKKAKQRAEFIHNTTNGKRDLEVLRNIVVLLSIYIAGGIPTLFFIISAVSIFYYIGIVSFTFSVMVEKTCTFLLDRELRLVVKNIIFSRNRVMPFENSITRGGHPTNVGRSQRTNAGTNM